MTRTALLALAGVLLGLLIATAGTLMLARARAAARAASSSSGSRTDVAQYFAAVAALIGFLLSSSAVAVLCAELVPLVGAGRTVVAGVAGVAAFALLGVVFSRLADHAEEGRPERVPTAVYAPRPADPPALANLERHRPVLPSGSSGVEPAESTSAPTAEPVATAPAEAVPSAGVVEPTQETATEDPRLSGDRPDDVAPNDTRREHRAEVTGDTEDTEDTKDTERNLDTGGTERSDGGFAGSPGDPEGGRESPPGPADPDAAGEPETGAPTAEEDGRAGSDLRAELGPEGVGPFRPGWVYRDADDHWYMAVAGPDGGCSLVSLPTFCLVGTDRPTYPLRVAGAGELAVVPLTADTDTDTPSPDGEASTADSPATRSNGSGVSTSPPD